MSRYHPLLVTLHWALALLIIAALTSGFFALAATPNADSEDCSSVVAHGRQNAEKSVVKLKIGDEIKLTESLAAMVSLRS